MANNSIIKALTPIPIFDSLQEQINAANSYSKFSFPIDLQYTIEFMKQYKGNAATYNAYRRELERLLQWADLIAQKSLVDMQRQDLEEFIAFCRKPPKNWISKQKYPRYVLQDGIRVPNINWRPFVSVGEYLISEKTLMAIFSILNSFFNYLVQVNYLKLNPLVQIRQKSKFFRRQQEARVIRRLSELQWSYVIETAEILTQEAAKYERTLFIISCLYGMYLRISELAYRDNWYPKMGDFYRDHDGLWWFKTIGKGNKERDISVSDAMLVALKRYRTYLNLSPLPAVGENMPLLYKENSKLPLISTRQIRDIVQYAFDRSIRRLEQDGFVDEANQLQAATVHWLRHTGISDDVKTRPREHVRDDAGHSSSATTDLYIDVEKRSRHLSAKNKAINSD